MSKKPKWLRKIVFDSYWIITKDPTYEELKSCLDDLLQKQENSLKHWLNNHSQYIRQRKIEDLQKSIKKFLQN